MVCLIRSVGAWLTVICLVVSLWRGSAAAVDPKFQINPVELDRQFAETAKPAQPVPVPAARRSSGGGQYTVKPGDHLHKILSREYGLTDRQVDEVVGRVKQQNNIADIRRLRVGQTIRIDLGDRSNRVAQSAKPQRTTLASTRTRQLPPETPRSIPPSSLSVTALEGVPHLRQVWRDLVGGDEITSEPLSLSGDNYSLSLDPLRYPVLPAVDGGRLLVDSGATLPPLVRSLLADKDPNLRIVRYLPGPRKEFVGSLLRAAKFYSLEENVAISFGTDPQLSVMADFRLEKSADSLLHQDVVLMNVDERHSALPPVLCSFLKSEGFRVMEPFASRDESAEPPRHRLCSIPARDPRSIVDSLLRTLALPYTDNRSIQLFDGGSGGVSLSVKADRYFEEKGERFVVACVSNDPVAYTLTRLLETQGYRVILVEGTDSLRSIAEKLLGRLKVASYYGRQELWPTAQHPYTVKLSGLLVPDRDAAGGRLIITDKGIDPLITELAGRNGYTVLTP